MLVIKGFEIWDMIQFRGSWVFGKQKAVYLPVLSGPLSPLQGFNIYLNFRGQMSNMKIFYEQNNFINCLLEMEVGTEFGMIITER